MIMKDKLDFLKYEYVTPNMTYLSSILPKNCNFRRIQRWYPIPFLDAIGCDMNYLVALPTLSVM